MVMSLTSCGRLISLNYFFFAVVCLASSVARCVEKYPLKCEGNPIWLMWLLEFSTWYQIGLNN